GKYDVSVSVETFGAKRYNNNFSYTVKSPIEVTFTSEMFSDTMLLKHDYENDFYKWEISGGKLLTTSPGELFIKTSDTINLYVKGHALIGKCSSEYNFEKLFTSENPKDSHTNPLFKNSIIANRRNSHVVFNNQNNEIGNYMAYSISGKLLASSKNSNKLELRIGRSEVIIIVFSAKNDRTIISETFIF
ncbi:MAG: hypothetical protein ACPGLV_00905, partial [Bacteroidia bacterium]